MERIELAALSKIADVLSDNNLSPLSPEVDVWKKVFYNAELGDMFEDRGSQFSIIIQSFGYRPEERNFYFNDKTYNALLESFQELQYRPDELLKLLNNIAKKMSLYRVLLPDVEEKIKSEYPKSRGKFFDDFFDELANDKKKDLIFKYSRKSFQELRRNLNIISLDIGWEEGDFCIIPFTDNMRTQSNIDINVVNQWLHNRYLNVYESYEAARKAFANGDEVGCITHCRNIITGIFSHKKDDGREWYSGLQKVCSADKNISTLPNPKAIPSIQYNAHSTDTKQRYQYPRFNLFNKLYVFTCDLGAHINEGNITAGVVDSERATLEDALLALRVTEDMLIWLYQTGNMDK